MYSVCVIVAEWCFRCFLIVGIAEHGGAEPCYLGATDG